MKNPGDHYNPLSQEAVGIHPLSKEEQAQKLGRTVEEYEKTVFVLDESNKEARERLTNYLEHGKYYDQASDWKAKRIVKKLLEDGRFDIKPYAEETRKHDYYPYYSVQTDNHAFSVVDYLLNDRKDMTWMNNEHTLSYDDSDKEKAA